MSDAPVSGTALSSTELTVSLTGLISAWTNLAAKLGDHFITVTAYLASYSSVTSTKSYTLKVAHLQSEALAISLRDHRVAGC